MSLSSPSRQSVTAQDIIERARELAPRFGKRADAAEEARHIPAESVKDMLDAGFARILLPREIGGYGLGFDAWYEVTRELSKADASHGWCAGLIIHHAHLIAQFPRAGQEAVWPGNLDVPVAASFAPVVKAVRADGGYRISSAGSPFASGVDHCTWVMLGGMTHDGPEPEWRFFLVPQGEYAVRDTWFTAGMRGTGSKTIVVADAFVPDSRILSLADLRSGKTPGAAIYNDIINRTPFFYYAPISFASPMLGAAQGAYEIFRDWTKTRKTMDGTPLAEKTSVQVQMARVAADIDAAELLLRRAAGVTEAPEAYSADLLARSIRDYTRVSELTISAIDTLIALSGTAGFASSHPLQRAWRDIHFMSMHISLNVETNFSHYGRLQLGLGPDSASRYF
ncbi:MAG TPA: acyl-CoA dehydrogenase family protein [Xanthobacteraceae bacterium]|jgi:3-hydroxy-9,10-secoandrosta-1,3,5(10)-triene-9,17-dione monooxygenase|nr:acyl-CoA dehydrogenase family protein [Xanthobacteraceae bacterium]